MFSGLGDAMAGVFAPIALEYTAKNDMQGLARQTRRALRFIGIAMALPIGILCGLSEPFLRRWLGDEFAKLSLLMWLLVGHGIVNIVIRPLFLANTALNKVKFPAIATIIGGCVNLIGAIVLVQYTPLGLYGVAVATVFSLMGKNLIFQPIYSAAIMGQRKTFFYRGLFSGFFIFALIALAMFGLSQLVDLATLPRLIGAGTAACLLYAATCYALIITKEDRAFLSSLFARWRTEHRR
jgi:membrane protein EpsK